MRIPHVSGTEFPLEISAESSARIVLALDPAADRKLDCLIACGEHSENESDRTEAPQRAVSGALPQAELPGQHPLAVLLNVDVLHLGCGADVLAQRFEAGRCAGTVLVR